MKQQHLKMFALVAIIVLSLSLMSCKRSCGDDCPPPPCNGCPTEPQNCTPTSITDSTLPSTVPAAGGTFSFRLVLPPGCFCTAVPLGLPSHISVAFPSSNNPTITYTPNTSGGASERPGVTASFCNFNVSLPPQAGTPAPTRIPMTLSWVVCNGAPERLSDCQQVSGERLSSYVLPRNADFKLYAKADHHRNAGCKIVGQITPNFGAGSSVKLGPEPEDAPGAPDPMALGAPFNTRRAPDNTGAYKIPIHFTETCDGGVTLFDKQETVTIIILP